NLVVLEVTPCEPHKHGIGCDQTGHCEPPDVPDQGETGYGREEGRHETGRTVPGHLDRLVLARLAGLLSFDRSLLDVPVRVLTLHIRRYREVECGRWRGRRPFQRTAVPRVPR